MPSDKIKIIGVTFSISFLSIIVLAFFIKALGVLLNSWFNNNSWMILIISGILLLFLVMTGTISLTAMTSKSKSLF